MKFEQLSQTKKGNYSLRCLTKNLKKLRSEICLNSLYFSDYQNSFGLDEKLVCAFFDGYIDFLCELEEEKYGKRNYLKDDDFFKEFDNIDTLIDWYFCHDEFGDE